MKNRVAALLGSMVLLTSALLATSSNATEFKSKAEEISLTGRVQAQWSHSTISPGVPNNEFLIRRARATLKIKINRWWSGVIQPDFAGGSLSLKDAYVKLQVHDNVSFAMGQAHRRFDLFELTSSTQILVIERDGRIGRAKVPSLSYFTETLEYSDRDTGVFVNFHDGKEMFNVDAAVTNGAGANDKAEFSDKAYSARLKIQPLEDRPLSIAAGLSTHPYGSDPESPETAIAYEGAVEYGTFDEGVHLQGGVVMGDTWKSSLVSSTFDPANPPSFFAVQGILTYKHALQSNEWFEAVEPLVRVSFADPDRDTDNDAGIVVTPGLNVFTHTRNRVSVNADIFLPQADGIDTEVGVKAQTWLYW